MELRHDNFAEALALMKRAVKPPSSRAVVERASRERQLRAQGRTAEADADASTTRSVQQRLHKSTKLWAFYVDLEESLGT